MSNYVEYKDKIAFHPGYYIKEIVEESGLTQEDFAKRLDTTPKNLSLLVRGEQNLSIDISLKLSRMMGTSINYWLKLQNAYDALMAEFRSDEELEKEKKVFSYLDYRYFRDCFALPDLPRKTDEQIKQVREFLGVSTLSVLMNRDLAVSFRRIGETVTEANTVKANAMVQIAINKALKYDAPSFNKAKFIEAVNYILTLTKRSDNFYPLIHDALYKVGVVFIVLPNLPGSKISGATKKIGRNVLLMISDKRLYSDSFWFTLFHEIGHIIHGDFGITFEKDDDGQEDAADKYAEDTLIPPELYQEFLDKNRIDVQSIKQFADRIERDPGIVLGRLLNDKKVLFSDWKLTNALRHKYKDTIVWVESEESLC